MGGPLHEDHGGGRVWHGVRHPNKAPQQPAESMIMCCGAGRATSGGGGALQRLCGLISVCFDQVHQLGHSPACTAACVHHHLLSFVVPDLSCMPGVLHAMLAVKL